MTEEQCAVIRDAISSITQSADTLRACHTSFENRDDWGNDHEAKADYDADVALVARLNDLLFASIADTAGAIDKKAIAWDAHQTCARIPGATHYNAAEIAIDAVLKSIAAPPAPSRDAAGVMSREDWKALYDIAYDHDSFERFMRAAEANIAEAVENAAGASESLPENIDWTRVMALAEKHGDGWSEAKGWSFHCDDDLFNFAGELAKESGK